MKYKAHVPFCCMGFVDKNYCPKLYNFNKFEKILDFLKKNRDKLLLYI